MINHKEVPERQILQVCGESDLVYHSGGNLDIEEFALIDELKEELMEWVSEYGKWIDFETDSLEENGLKLVENHI